MKYFFVLLSIMLCLAGCTPDTRTDDYRSVLLPIETIDLPTKFKVDSVSVITIHYKKPNTCNIFNGFYYSKSEMTRTVAINSVEMLNSNCLTDNTIIDVSLKFQPQQSGDYTFKFWQGTSTTGTDNFLTNVIHVEP
jgi:hypothetical protein